MEGLEAFAKLGFSALGVVTLLALLLSFSAYIKIVTVLSVLRSGLGWNSLPAAFVTAGLAFALALFVMTPTIRDSSRAVDSVIRDRATVDDATRGRALDSALSVWRIFLEKHSHPTVRDRFQKLADQLNGDSGRKDQASPADANEATGGWQVAAPSFVVSQLEEAFSIGLKLLLPLLVIDLLVATVLVAVGYEKVSPHYVSFPLKLLLFVAVDGWTMITTNLVASYL